MLVLANGAYKCGSTWLATILTQLVPGRPVPAEYRNPSVRVGWLAESRIAAFLASGLHRRAVYHSKGHVHAPRLRDLLLADDDVVVFDITRDLRDAVVSHYYHFRRQQRVTWDFPTYYRRMGRYKAHQIVRYHEVWAVPHPRVYVSSFERLKEDYAGEVRRLAGVLGTEVDDDQIERIRERSSLRTMARRWRQDDRPAEERHFRKGATGDWREHFDEESLADLAAIERGEMGVLGRLAFHSLFTARHALAEVYYDRLKPLVARPVR